MLNDLEIKDLQELCKENRKNIIKTNAFFTISPNTNLFIKYKKRT